MFVCVNNNWHLCRQFWSSRRISGADRRSGRFGGSTQSAETLFGPRSHWICFLVQQPLRLSTHCFQPLWKISTQVKQFYQAVSAKPGVLLVSALFVAETYRPEEVPGPDWRFVCSHSGGASSRSDVLNNCSIGPSFSSVKKPPTNWNDVTRTA